MRAPSEHVGSPILRVRGPRQDVGTHQLPSGQVLQREALQRLCREGVCGICKSLDKVVKATPPALVLSPARLVLTCPMGKQTCATHPSGILLEEGPHVPAQPRPAWLRGKGLFLDLM